jgi:hypothetical protein
VTATGTDVDRVNAIGTRLRLRALGAMGHSDSRIARALGTSPCIITAIITGATRTVTPELRELAVQLYDAWWDKTPPERTPAERAAATAARNRARRRRWCPGMGLDDDELEDPDYKPRCTWRPATGTGVADDDPLGKGGTDTKTAGAAQLPGTAAPAQTTTCRKDMIHDNEYHTLGA